MRKNDIVNLLEQEPEDVFLNYALAMELLNENEALAISQFQKVIKLDANYVAAYYQLALLYINNQKSTEALSILKTALALAKEQNRKHTVAEINALIMEIEDE